VSALVEHVADDVICALDVHPYKVPSVVLQL
jgi:hypothetical protein